MTINDVVRVFQETKCEVAFEQIYQHIHASDRYITNRFSARYSLDKHDVESLINEKIFTIAVKFDGKGKYKNAVYQAVKEGCIDLLRKKVRIEQKSQEVMYMDDDGALNEVYEIIEVATTTTEEDIIAELKKRDQRQLITFLLSNANEPTLTSASAFIDTDSYRKAAKQIGSTDKTVKSRIRKLSKRYDVNLHGSYYDYFTAPTVYVG